MQETVVTSLRLPRELKRQGRVEAALKETTFNQLICWLLEDYINKQPVPTIPQKESTLEHA